MFTERASFKQVAIAAEFCSAGSTGSSVFAVQSSNGRNLRLICHWQDGQSVVGEMELRSEK